MKYRVVVSPSIFRESYVWFYTNWWIWAWLNGQWLVGLNPHAAVFIQSRK